MHRARVNMWILGWLAGVGVCLVPMVGCSSNESTQGRRAPRQARPPRARVALPAGTRGAVETCRGARAGSGALEGKAGAVTAARAGSGAPKGKAGAVTAAQGAPAGAGGLGGAGGQGGSGDGGAGGQGGLDGSGAGWGQRTSVSPNPDVL